jgi:hypothetical protein
MVVDGWGGTHRDLDPNAAIAEEAEVTENAEEAAGPEKRRADGGTIRRNREKHAPAR